MTKKIFSIFKGQIEEMNVVLWYLAVNICAPNAALWVFCCGDVPCSVSWAFYCAVSPAAAACDLWPPQLGRNRVLPSATQVYQLTMTNTPSASQVYQYTPSATQVYQLTMTNTREDLNLKESYKENTQRRDYTPLQVQQSSPETKVAKMASIGLLCL